MLLVVLWHLIKSNLLSCHSSYYLFIFFTAYSTWSVRAWLAVISRFKSLKSSLLLYNKDITTIYRRVLSSLYFIWNMVLLCPIFKYPVFLNLLSWWKHSVLGALVVRPLRNCCFFCLACVIWPKLFLRHVVSPVFTCIICVFIILADVLIYSSRFIRVLCTVLKPTTITKIVCVHRYHKKKREECHTQVF